MQADFIIKPSVKTVSSEQRIDKKQDHADWQKNKQS